MIRKRIKLSPEKAIFIFVDEVLPPTAALMSSIYEEHKDEDGYVFPLSAFHNVIPLYRHRYRDYRDLIKSQRRKQYYEQRKIK